MSGNSINKKINKAAGKVSGKLGFTCDLYRPDNYVDPLADRNYLETLQVAWSVDESFSKNPVDELDHYKVYISNEKAFVGDWLVCEEHGKTFAITETDPIRISAGIMCNDRMNILRSQATPLLDVKISLVEVCSQVPCAIKVGNASAVSIQYTDGRSGQSNITVWSMIPIDDVQIGDVLETRNNRWTVTSLNNSSKGTKITASSNTPGK